MAVKRMDLDLAQTVGLTNGPPKPYALKRRCFECGAFLSRYNRSEKYCFNHEPTGVRRFIW